jgi:hypothetical protein
MNKVTTAPGEDEDPMKDAPYKTGARKPSPAAEHENNNMPMNKKKTTRDGGAKDMPEDMQPEQKEKDETGGTISPKSSKSSLEAVVTTRVNNSSPSAFVTQLDEDPSAEKTIRLVDFSDIMRSGWESRLTRDFYEEVFPGNPGSDYRFLWVKRRPYVRFEDLLMVINYELVSYELDLHSDFGPLDEFDSSEFDLSRWEIRGLKFFDDFGVYLPLDDAINLIPNAGDLYYDLFDFCHLRKELKCRCAGAGDPSKN